MLQWETLPFSEQALSVQAFCAVAYAVLVAWLSFGCFSYLYRHKNSAASVAATKPCLHFPLPPDVKWLTAKQFVELEALIDTLLPAFDTSNVSALHSASLQSFRELHFNQHVSPELEQLISRKTQELLPSLARAASELGIPALFAQGIQKNISPGQQRDLARLLGLLSTRAGALVLTGSCKRFSKQSFAARHEALRCWSVSSLPPLRQAFQGFKRLACSLYYSALVPADAAAADSKAPLSNPNWTDLKYSSRHIALDSSSSTGKSSGGSSKTTKVKAVTTGPSELLHTVPAPETVEFDVDVVIVGSGGKLHCCLSCMMLTACTSASVSHLYLLLHEARTITAARTSSLAHTLRGSIRAVRLKALRSKAVPAVV
jgi:hypothetical protein